MRLRQFILGAAIIVACTKAALHFGTTWQLSVVVTGNGAFGEQVIDTTSDPHTFVVSTSGTTTLDVDEIESIDSTCTEFIVNAPGLPLANPATDKGPEVHRLCVEGVYGGSGFQCTSFDEKTYQFTIVFAPKALGPTNADCRAIVRLKGGGTTVVPLSGTGVLPDFIAKVAPTPPGPVDFQEVAIGITGHQFVTITSGGRKDLRLEGAAVTTDANAEGTTFALVGGNITTPQDIASKALDITCSPGTTPGTATGTLTIRTNDPKQLVIALTLKCKVIQSSVNATVSSVALRNGAITTNIGQPVPINVDVTNISLNPITIDTVTVTEAVPGTLSAPTTIPGTPIQPGQTVTTTLSWTPTPEPYTGSLGTITIGPGGGENTHTFALGTGVSLLAVVASNQMIDGGALVDFGKVCIGPPAFKKIQMQAGTMVGVNAPYQIGELEILQLNVPDVFEARLVGGSTVDIGAGADIEVKTHALLGVRETMMIVHTDSPTQPTYPVTLKVEGLIPGATVSRNELSFQRTIVGGFAGAKTSDFLNCFDTPVDLTGITLDGASAPDFQVKRVTPEGKPDQMPPFTVMPGQHVQIEVQMLPQTEGVKAARVLIDYQRPDMPATDEETISVSGEAFENREGGTYYTCSAAGKPAWLVAGVVWLVVRRRKRRYASGSDGRRTQDSDRSDSRR